MTTDPNDNAAPPSVPSVPSAAPPTPCPDPEHPNCFRVPLTGRAPRVPRDGGGSAAGHAIIDADALPLLDGRPVYWSEHPGGANGHVALVGRKGAQLRRLVTGVTDPGLCVGHANGDPLDCRRANLVVDTFAARQRGSRKHSSHAGRACSSRYKGVCWCRNHRRWVVNIGRDGVQRYVGRFWDEAAAARAYDRAARELFGEHARLNFPNDGSAPAAAIDTADLTAAAADTDTADTTPAFAAGSATVDHVVRDDESDPHPHAGVPFPPGTVGRADAARMFGVSLGTWDTWESAGRVTCGRRVLMPSGGLRKFYLVDDLVTLREAFRRLVEPHPDPDRTGCYRVPITSDVHRGMAALIDADDLPLVRGRSWNWSPRPDAVRGGEVVTATITAPSTPLRRLIAGAGAADQRVMHLDGDPLNCRRANLVVRTPSEQMFAARKMSARDGRACSSRYKGVVWDAGRGKWMVRITREGVQRHVGRFRDELAAAQAYDEAARVLFGTHARLNFPDGIDAALEGPPTTTAPAAAAAAAA